MSVRSVPRAAPAAQPAVRATSVAFIGAGFVFATWASRIPQVRDRLHLSSAQLGLVLLAVAIGSITALVMAGPIVHRLGSRRVVGAGAFVAALALAGLGVAYLVGVVALACVLALYGFCFGAWDVAMNVQGATAERLSGRSVMPRFHAGFSVGTVAGAVVGAAMQSLSVPVTTHFAVAAVLLVATVPWATRNFAPDVEDEQVKPRSSGTLLRWREPRTLLIGVFVLAFAFAEGTGNDWIGVSFIDGHHVSSVAGTLGFACFLAAMTTGRWFGPGLLDRYGRVSVVRGLTILAVGGLLVYVFSPLTWLAFAGTVLWGLGTSLGFPVGMSAAADDPAAAAGRVSVVAAIGYLAFLGGPPLIGFLGEQTSVLHALTAAAVLLALAALLADTVRRPDRSGPDGLGPS